MQPALWLREVAPVADVLDRQTPYGLGPARAIRRPAVGAVKALSTRIADQDPQQGTAKSLFEQVGPSRSCKRLPDAAAPSMGIDVKRAQLAIIRHVRVAGWHGGCEAADHPRFNSHDGIGLERIGAAERVSLRTVLGTKLIEVIIRHEPAVCRLPRSHMDARHRHRVFGFGNAQLHIGDDKTGVLQSVVFMVSHRVLKDPAA